MAKLKFDVKKIKELFTSRFEILAVAAAGCLVVVCLVWGLSTYLSASSPEPGIRESIADLEGQRARAERPAKAAPGKTDLLYGWPLVTGAQARLSQDPWFVAGAAGANNRSNPRILAMDNDPEGKSFQLDYIHKGIHTYDVNMSQEKLFAFPGTTSPVPVLLVAAKRLVVVSGTFPYLDQAEFHRKALRVDKLDELFSKGYAPTMEGLNVQRRKIIFKDGKQEAGKWEDLYMADESSTDKVAVSSKIEKTLKTAVIDDRQGENYRDVIHGMSVTPLPKLAGNVQDAKYPEVRLRGVIDRLPQNPPDKTGKKDFGPPPKSGGSDLRPLGPLPTRTLPNPAVKEVLASSLNFSDLQQQSLKDQLAGNLNWFSPFGTSHDEPQKKLDDQKSLEPKVVRGDGLEPMVNHKARNVPPVNSKALVRFVDIDPESGATYQYRIQLRFANPNYKQPAKLLAHSGLADIKELVSDWVETPTVSIPADADYKFYITHQDKAFVSKVQTIKGISHQKDSFIADKYVPVQVFRFIDIVREKGKDHYLADWVVAERLLVARGEPIGRECDVEIAEWTKLKSQWEIGGVSGPKVSGVTVDFRAEPATVLLDFAGGTQFYKNPRTGFPGGPEESETEALLLMPDMTMKLRNSREDNDEANSPVAQERRELFDVWKARLEDLRPQPKGPPGKGDKGGG